MSHEEPWMETWIGPACPAVPVDVDCSGCFVNPDVRFVL